MFWLILKLVFLKRQKEVSKATKLGAYETVVAKHELRIAYRTSEHYTDYKCLGYDETYSTFTAR